MWDSSGLDLLDTLMAFIKSGSILWKKCDNSYSAYSLKYSTSVAIDPNQGHFRMKTFAREYRR